MKCHLFTILINLKFLHIPLCLKFYLLNQIENKNNAFIMFKMKIQKKKIKKKQLNFSCLIFVRSCCHSIMVVDFWFSRIAPFFIRIAQRRSQTIAVTFFNPSADLVTTQQSAVARVFPNHTRQVQIVHIDFDTITLPPKSKHFVMSL